MCRNPSSSHIFLPSRSRLPYHRMDPYAKVPRELDKIPQVRLPLYSLVLFSKSLFDFDSSIAASRKAFFDAVVHLLTLDSVIFSGTGSIPPANAVNYVTWSIVGFIFQYIIRRRHFSWWTKYNCTSVFLKKGLLIIIVLFQMYYRPLSILA